MADFKREVKIQRLVDTYGVSYEKANYIVYTDDIYLDTNDLKMKYNNPDMGKLPDWLSDNSLSALIWSSIKKYSSVELLKGTTYEDLYQDIQVFIRMRSNKLVNFSFLKIMIRNYIINRVSDNRLVDKYIPVNLDTPIGNNEDKGCTIGELVKSDNKEDEVELIELIESIRDKNLKKFLIVIGYLMCNINSLKVLYQDVLNNSSESVKSNLIEVEKNLLSNDLIKDKRKYNEKVSKSLKIINAKTIIKALELNKYTFDTIEYKTKTRLVNKPVKLTTTDILEDFKYYLINMNIFKCKSSLY